MIIVKNPRKKNRMLGKKKKDITRPDLSEFVDHDADASHSGEAADLRCDEDDGAQCVVREDLLQEGPHRRLRRLLVPASHC